MTARRRPEPLGDRVAAWTPIGLAVAAVLAPGLRLPILAVTGAAAVIALRRARGEPLEGPAVAWCAVLPVTVALAVGLLPDPPVPDPGRCDDLAAPPVVRRVVQATVVLGTVGALATRLGGRRSLGVVRPPDRRVTILAAATPLLVPLAFLVGPPLAAPFFGEVRLGLPSAAALLPAAVLAVANAAQEEVAYRGALQRWGAAALGRRGAIAAQAVVFGTAHLGPDTTGGAPVLWLGMVAAGLVAGLVADRTRSLLLPFAAHAAIDVPLALALTCRLA